MAGHGHGKLRPMSSELKLSKSFNKSFKIIFWSLVLSESFKHGQAQAPDQVRPTCTSKPFSLPPVPLKFRASVMCGHGRGHGRVSFLEKSWGPCEVLMFRLPSRGRAR